MYLRKRNSNLSIERAVYEPAIKDEQGAIIKAAVRTTAYIGSIGVHERYRAVPDKILERLSEEEKEELRKALATNEPDPHFWLDELPGYMGLAARQLRDNSKGLANPEEKKSMEARVKRISEAWDKFFKEAQDCGLKRKAKRSSKPKKTGPNPAP
jgi:hypothetical protein